MYLNYLPVVKFLYLTLYIILTISNNKKSRLFGE